MSKQNAILAAKLLVTGALVYWVLRGVEPQALLGQLDRASPSLLLAAALLIFCQNSLVIAWRWERVLSIIDRRPPAWSLLRPTVVALFFNQVLPSTIGGDGLRAWFLRQTGRPIGLAIRSVAIDRLVGGFSQLILGCLGAVYLVCMVEAAGSLWALAAASLAGMALIATIPTALRRARRLPFERLRRSLDVVLAELDLLRADKRGLAAVVVVSMIGQLMLSGAVVLLSLGFGIAVDPVGVFALVPAVMMASMIPISIAGWGLREGTMVLGFGLLGVGHSDAALVSICFGLLFLAYGLLGGMIWLAQGAQRPVYDLPRPGESEAR